LYLYSVPTLHEMYYFRFTGVVSCADREFLLRLGEQLELIKTNWFGKPTTKPPKFQHFEEKVTREFSKTDGKVIQTKLYSYKVEGKSL